MDKLSKIAIWVVLGLNVLLIFFSISSQVNDRMYIDGLEAARQSAEANNQRWKESNDLIKAELELKQKQIEVYEEDTKRINYQNAELIRLLRDQLAELKKQ